MKSIVKFISFLILMLPTLVMAQVVSTSEVINIRNDYGYEILGDVNDQILLYRDKGYEQRLMVYDKSLEFVREREIDVKKKKSRIMGLAKRDTSFLAFYSYKEDGSDIIGVTAFNEYAEEIDTLTIYEKKKTFFGGRDYVHLLSEDKSKTLIYSIEKKNEFLPVIFDNENFENLLVDEYKIENRNLRQDLIDVMITNQGDVLLLLELNNSRFKNENHLIEIIYIQGRTGAVSISQLSLKDIYTQSIHMSYDNYRRNVSVSGLYNDKSSSESKGYFYAEKPVANPLISMKAIFHEFNQKFIDEIYRE